MQKTELKPSYYDQFACIGGACEDTCCAGWRIDIDKKSYQKYKNEKNPTIREELKKNTQRNRQSQNDLQYGKFKLDADGKCTMLDEENLCTIQKTLGEKALCHTCTIYPRQNIQINQTIEKSLDTSCPEAARLILLNKNGIDFIEDKADIPTFSFNYLEQKDEIRDYFWVNRMFMIQVLQNRTHPIELRLLLIGLYMKKLESLPLKARYKQAEKLAATYLPLASDLELPEMFKEFKPNYVKHQQLATYFLKSFVAHSERFRLVAGLAFEEKDLQKTDIFENTQTFEDFIKKYRPIYNDNEAIQIVLENYLVNLIFSSYHEKKSQDVLAFFSYLTVQFVLIRLLIIGNVNKLQMNEHDLVTTIQAFSKAGMHNKHYIPKSLELISLTDYSKISQAIHILVL